MTPNTDPPSPRLQRTRPQDEHLDGAASIAAERRRQVDEEGWTAEHDDEHCDGALAMAAACYATPAPLFVFGPDGEPRDPWPWEPEDDKRAGGPSIVERRADLVKAGALIAAEIDRLDRAAERRAINEAVR